MLRLLNSIVRKLNQLWEHRGGSIFPTFAIALVPIISLAGAAVDYGRASDLRAKMQSALDAAVLSGANDGTSNWTEAARDTFQAAYGEKFGLSATANFSMAGSQYYGESSSTIPTTLLTPFGYKSISVSTSSTAFVSAPQSETSCLLSLGENQAADSLSMTFSGSPNVLLTGCALRSNTSMKRNGHDTGALSSTSVGTTTNCSNPVSAARYIPDIYKALASNITPKCLTSYSNITWRPDSPPSSILGPA